jgi:hypothetical protein
VVSGGVIAQGIGGLVAQPALASGHALASSDFMVLHQSVGERLGRSLFKKAIKKERTLGLGPLREARPS